MLRDRGYEEPAPLCTVTAVLLLVIFFCETADCWSGNVFIILLVPVHVSVDLYLITVVLNFSNAINMPA